MSHSGPLWSTRLTDIVAACNFVWESGDSEPSPENYIRMANLASGKAVVGYFESSVGLSSRIHMWPPFQRINSRPQVQLAESLSRAMVFTLNPGPFRAVLARMVDLRVCYL